ncbi:putative transposase [Bradyrhizobium sp. IAR9]|nr:putative transposase [Bradyrhizobium sp. IAR9]
MNAPLIRLNTGDAVVIDGVWYKEDSRTTGALTLSAIGSGIQRTFTGDELRDLYFDPAGRMKIVRKHMAALKEELREVVSRPFESFSVEQQAEMIKRLDYVNACDRFFGRKLYSKRPDEGYASIAKIVARHRRFVRARLENCATSGVPLEAVSGSTLRDWYGRWCKSGRMLGALAPRWHRRGNTKTVRMDPAIRMIIADAVREKWLTLEAPPLTVVYDYICQKVVKRNENVGDGDLSAPSEMAVRRWIKKNVDPYTQTFFRLGKKEADQQFRLTRKAPVAVRPLEIVEYDDTPLDIILVDANGRVRGRAYLTAGICLATGMIVGWHISKDRPSWSTVMQALRMTVLKKDLADSGAESPYPVFGVPEMVKVDNGAAYRSTSLVAAAGQLQFELRLVPVGKPNLKGKVERFFREVARDFLSVFPGRTFSNVQERLDYDSEGNARMTLQDAQRLFTRWVVDIYHNRPNSRSFGQTPLQRWEALSGCGVRMPPEAADLTPLIGLVVNRTIQGDGITFMGLTYRDEALRAMRRSGHMGKEWMVKVDPLDLSVMLVLDEAKKRWVPIRCQQPDLVEGLTLKMWMDVVANAKAATERGQRVSRGRLLRAREALILEAQAMGNRPRGKITVAEYSWIESELNNPKYEVDADLSDPDAHAKAATTPGAQRKKEQRARAKSAPLGAEAPADDPTMVEPASKAKGYPIVDVDLPGRELKERELEVSRDIEDLEEKERLAEFRAASRGKPTEATDDDSVAQTPASDGAEAPSLAPDETEVSAADAVETPPDHDVTPPLAPDDEPPVASGTTKGPRRLVDEDDDEHFGA